MNCNVLITSAGRRVSLVQLFQQAIAQLGVNGKVFAVDMQEHAPALQVADESQTIVRVTDVGSSILEVSPGDQVSEISLDKSVVTDPAHLLNTGFGVHLTK